MIKLVFTGKCKDCNQADLYVDKVDMLDGQTEYIVRCDHDGACERMKEMQEGEG